MENLDPTASIESPKAGGEEQKVNFAPLLGAATALMMESPAHQHLFISDMKWLLIPPLRLQQFRIFKKEGVPVAYVSWAFLNEEAERRITGGQVRLRPDEWKSGDNVWLIDVVTPFGAQEEILKELKHSAFEDQDVKMLKYSSDGLTSEKL